MEGRTDDGVQLEQTGGFAVITAEMFIGLAFLRAADANPDEAGAGREIIRS